MYRGVLPYCTACGALRVPLSSPSVNLAGKPAKVGGTVAGVAGWSILTVGLSLALGVGLLAGFLISAGVGLAVASPIGLVALVAGLALVLSGRSLRRTGVDAQRATREQGLLALLEHQGAVTAMDGARVLGLSVPEADAMLTELAKRVPERVAVDVDEQGLVWYRAAGLAARVRVGDGAGVRVGETGDADATASADEGAAHDDRAEAKRR